MSKEEKVENEEVVEEVDTGEEVKDNDTEDMIPYDRFKEVNDERNKLREKLDSMPDLDEYEREYNNKEKKLTVKERALEEGVSRDRLDDFITLADLDKVEKTEEGYVGVDELINTMKESKDYFFSATSGVDKAGEDFNNESDNVGNDDTTIREIMGL